MTSTEVFIKSDFIFLQLSPDLSFAHRDVRASNENISFLFISAVKINVPNHVVVLFVLVFVCTVKWALKFFFWVNFIWIRFSQIYDFRFVLLLQAYKFEETGFFFSHCHTLLFDFIIGVNNNERIICWLVILVGNNINIAVFFDQSVEFMQRFISFQRSWVNAQRKMFRL